MTPYEITLLLHYYSSPADPKGDEPIRRETLQSFLDSGLLKEREQGAYPGEYSRWERTDRLKAYVEALMETPLPIQKWVMP